MAKLPDEILTIIFTLQRQLVEGIDEAAATELLIFEQFGETEVTLPALEQLQNVRERLMSPYSRLSTLLLRIAEYQPTAPADMLDLLIGLLYKRKPPTMLQQPVFEKPEGTLTYDESAQKNS